MIFGNQQEERRWAEPNLALTDVKRQHYVPRVYLKAFTDSDGRLAVHDLGESRAFNSSAAAVAVAKGFYDIEASGFLLSTERWLADVESAAAPLLTRLADDPAELLALSANDELCLARFLVALYLRVPAFREQNQRTTDGLVTFLKDMAKRHLDAGGYGVEKQDAAKLWETWQSKPDHWWIGEEEPYTGAQLTADMLEETQGLANLLRAKPWRTGRVPSGMQLYTSDNPMSRWLTPIRPWWEHEAFGQLDFWIPLSPKMLLRIGRMYSVFEDEEAAIEPRPQGSRECRDFTEWEASFARHMLTLNATRFLFGDTFPVNRECAENCIRRIEQAMLATANEFSGFDPNPPASIMPRQ